MGMNALATWMTAAGETDDTVSAKVGISRVQVSRIRRSLSRPSPELAVKLEALSGVPAWDLVSMPLSRRAAGEASVQDAA